MLKEVCARVNNREHPANKFRPSVSGSLWALKKGGRNDHNGSNHIWKGKGDASND